MYPVKNAEAITVTFFAHDVNGDAVLSVVDGSWTKRISKNGAAFGAMVVVITEMENGWYSFPLSATHSDTNGVMTLVFTTGATKQVNLQFRVHTRLPDDLAFPATSGRSMGVETDGHVHADLKEWLGVAPLALASQRPQVEVDAYDATVDFNATQKASVNTEVSDVLKTDLVADRAQQTPPAMPTFEDILSYLYMAWRNELTQDADTLSVKNDAGTVVCKATVSDVAGTYTKGEMATGP